MCLLISFILSIIVVISGILVVADRNIIGKDSIQVTSNESNKMISLKKGKTFTKGKFRYKVVSLNGKKGKLSLIGTKSKTIKLARIPKKVKMNGYDLKVTAIGKKAFMNCTNLKSITTKAKITSIGKQAFYGCINLKKINISDRKLKKVGKDAFNGIYKEAVKVTKQKNKTHKSAQNNKGQAAEVNTESVHTHKYSEWKTIIFPTCTTKGKQISTCSCNDVQVRIIPELGHNYSEYFIVDSVATCNTEGSMSRHCIRCNSRIDAKIIKTGHAFTNYVYNNDAKCTEDGTETAKCMYCDETFTRIKENSALDHNYSDEFNVDVEPTCDTDGTKSKHCSRCNARNEITKIDKLGHDFVNYIFNNDATCTENGTETAKCSRCAAKNTRTKQDSELGHDYSKGFTVDINATCETDGLKSKHCSRCNARDEITKIDKLGHDFVNYIFNNDATCTENGTETAKCSRCDAKNTRTKQDSALGHDYSKGFTIDTKATCETDGLKSKHCSRCNARNEITKIDKLGHDFSDYTYNNDATCVADGTETAICSRCNREDTRIKTGTALGYSGHKFGDWETVIEVTCTKWGTIARTCSICGEKENEIVQPLGHSFEKYISNNDATCTEDGTETAKCERCDETDSHTVYGSALGHKYSNEFIVDTMATCEKSGSQSRHCIRCGDKTDITTIKKLGHDFANYIYNNNATCTENGTETATCSRCAAKNTRTKQDSALGHDYSKGFTIDTKATCETAGSQSRHCIRCDAKKDIETIEKLGHDFAVYAYNNNATCTSDGTETAICSRCNKTDVRTETGSALGHDYADKFTIDAKATCEKDGSKSKHCSRCDAKTQITTIEKLGHNYSDYTYNDDATCINDGTETAVCNRCMKEDTRTREGTALGYSGHKFGDWKTDIQVTCTKWGTIVRTCSICGEKETEIVQALGHSFEKYISNNDATCTEDGTETAKCERCDETDSHIVYGSALGHKYSDQFTVDIEATCVKAGSKSKHCIRCDDKIEVTKIKNLGHSYTNYVYNEDATCTADGTETAKCDRCESTKKRIKEGSAKGHIWDNATNKCLVCGASATEEIISRMIYNSGFTIFQENIGANIIHKNKVYIRFFDVHL